MIATHSLALVNHKIRWRSPQGVKCHKYRLSPPKDPTPLLCHLSDSTSLTSGLRQIRCADLLEWVKRLPHSSFTRRKLLVTSSLARALRLFIQIPRNIAIAIWAAPTPSGFLVSWKKTCYFLGLSSAPPFYSDI